MPFSHARGSSPALSRCPRRLGRVRNFETEDRRGPGYSSLALVGKAPCAARLYRQGLGKRRAEDLELFLQSSFIEVAGQPGGMPVISSVESPTSHRSDDVVEDRLHSAGADVRPQRLRDPVPLGVVDQKARPRSIEVLDCAPPLPGLDPFDAAQLLQHLDVMVERLNAEADFPAYLGRAGNAFVEDDQDVFPKGMVERPDQATIHEGPQLAFVDYLADGLVPH
jgi:hypothetical protein